MEWVKGRAFVYAEEGQIEYFYRFETSDIPHLKGICIRSFCGGLRPLDQCRPLDYICKPKYLEPPRNIKILACSAK